VKATGSFASFRGIKATGASGLGAAFAADAVGGGDTGRVADRGNASTPEAAVPDFVGAALALLVPLCTTVVLSCGMIEPTKTGVGAASTGATGSLGTFVPSLSFKRFLSGSPSSATRFCAGDEWMTGGLETSWLKMQLGSSHLPAAGHAILPNELNAGIEGHIAVGCATKLAY
jgi:hypothetical protein